MCVHTFFVFTFIWKWQVCTVRRILLLFRLIYWPHGFTQTTLISRFGRYEDKWFVFIYKFAETFSPLPIAVVHVCECVMRVHSSPRSTLHRCKINVFIIFIVLAIASTVASAVCGVTEIVLLFYNPKKRSVSSLIALLRFSGFYCYAKCNTYHLILSFRWSYFN